MRGFPTTMRRAAGFPAWLSIATAVMFLVGPQVARATVEIDHDPVKKARSGQRIVLEAELEVRGGRIREARAYFKSGHDTRFWFAPMRAQGGDQHTAVLPAAALGAESVDYRIYAVSTTGDFVKTELFTIRIEDDEKALARAEARQPTDIEIDLDRIEQLRDLAEAGGEPDPTRRVEVRSDSTGSQTPEKLVGFDDYIVYASAAPAASGAGLAGAATVEVSKGGSFGKVLAGAAVLGGVAVAASESASDDDDGGSSGGGSSNVSVTLRNSGVDNIHICIDCSGSQFTTENRLGPGQSRAISVSLPSGQQTRSVRFNAGRNGAVRASATCTVDRSRSLTVRYTETGFNVGSALRCE